MWDGTPAYIFLILQTPTDQLLTPRQHARTPQHCSQSRLARTATAIFRIEKYCVRVNTGFVSLAAAWRRFLSERRKFGEFLPTETFPDLAQSEVQK